MSLITTIITTIGRPTLWDAVRSVGNHPVIVVSDGVPLAADVPHVVLGMPHGQYGCAAWNVGCALAQTEYVTKLDDDDEFLPGALDVMEAAVAKDLAADIWIPGLLYNDGLAVCCDPWLGVVPGNVACPTMRTTLAVRNPITVCCRRPDLTDYCHLAGLFEKGARVRWYEKTLIAVRPKLPGRHGAGTGRMTAAVPSGVDERWIHL